MKIARTVLELNTLLNQLNLNSSIGFVPTMGALHQGHISLINESKKQCQFTVCSIFVNPTQFNDKKDLERYPRNEEKDLILLNEAKCDLVFLPSVNEMYPEPDNRVFDFGTLDKVLDGDARPGHFNGVAQIVSKLFNSVKPTKAFFGLKDYQQVLIIKNLVKQLNLNVEIIACPILREKDGLAMSSRNSLLTTSERKLASLIPQLMSSIPSLKKAGYSFNRILLHFENKFSTQDYKLDYLKLANAQTLQIEDEFNDEHQQIVLIACFVGKIRLIDNIII